MKVYTYNDKVLVNSANDKWLKKAVNPYNPLGLPAGVMRFEAVAGWSPSSYDTSSLQFTQVSASPNIWDMKVLSGSGINNGATGSMTKILGFNATGLTGYSTGLSNRISGSESTLTECGPMYLPGFIGNESGYIYNTFAMCSKLTSVGNLYMPDLIYAHHMFYGCSSLTAVPLFDTSNVTDISNIFNGCSSLTAVPLFDTSNVTDMSQMLKDCTSLTTIPLFNTGKVTNVNLAFAGCYNVESGALAMYNQMSTQTTPPSSHSTTFGGCGSNTVTGAAELAQIPTSWGGRAS